MRTLIAVALTVVFGLAAVGCGPKASNTGNTTTPASTTPAPPPGAPPAS